jgi:aminoglycoside/choline kinase family phosphotransferase
VDELIAYFIALKRPSGTPQAEFLTWEREFRTRFDVMALQRNLKALGTFGYQTSVRRNPVYIQYIPRTIRHVQKNLARHKRFARLRELLGEVMEEVR